MADKMLAAHLGKRYLWDGDIVRTLGEQLRMYPPIRKTRNLRVYETHKRNGYYKKLETPKWDYTIWYQGGGCSVPKSVYDLYDVPETVTRDYDPDAAK